MTCKICGKEGARERHVTESSGSGEEILLIEGVPLISCPNCGESYYTAKTLHELEDIKQHRKGATRRNVEVIAFRA